MKLYPKKILSIFFNQRNFFCFLLTIVVTIFFGQVFELPANSQVLSPQQLGEIIEETETSWEQEYEAYFNTDFTNYAKTKSQAEFNPGSAKNSYIEFADSKLSLDKVQQLNLDNPPVDLLVLSACQTAVGDKQAEFGFAGLFLEVGAKSILASLWDINDLGTTILMTEFYQNLKSNSLKVKALQQTQIAMLKGKISFPKGQLRNSQEKISRLQNILDDELINVSHPFYWAGFTLIGNPW